MSSNEIEVLPREELEQRVRDLLGNEIVDTYLGDEAGSRNEIVATFLAWLADPGAAWNNYLEWLEGDVVTPRYYVTVYIMGSGGCYGRSQVSAVQAKKNARKQGGHGNRWITYLLPEDAEEPFVNNFGSIQWRWPDGWTKDQLEEANAKRRPIIVDQSRLLIREAKQKKDKE